MSTDQAQIQAPRFWSHTMPATWHGQLSTQDPSSRHRVSPHPRPSQGPIPHVDTQIPGASPKQKPRLHWRSGPQGPQVFSGNVEQTSPPELEEPLEEPPDEELDDEDDPLELDPEVVGSMGSPVTENPSVLAEEVDVLVVELLSTPPGGQAVRARKKMGSSFCMTGGAYLRTGSWKERRTRFKNIIFDPSLGRKLMVSNQSFAFRQV